MRGSQKAIIRFQSKSFIIIIIIVDGIVASGTYSSYIESYVESYMESSVVVATPST